MNFLRIFVALAMLALMLPAQAGEVTASYYRGRGPHGAASRTLPMGTRLLLYNPLTGKHSWVVIKDRGPFVRGRNLDVPRHIARELGFIKRGTARLRVERMGRMRRRR